jgi:wyosine [tRNA(Phe)-imidazoG37] synthetase (radical SAM superfamily)
VPYKTCSYDCLYCQLGPTTNKTVARAEYVPLGEVVAEVRAKLAAGIRPDFITLSGSGEPTLYSRLGELVGALKGLTSVPLAVLTNGSLLGEPEVRAALRDVDLVVPSLDAGDEATFQRVNRPAAEIGFAAMVAGLKQFRAEFPGTMWLEVFLLDGITSSPAEVEKIARLAAEIGPDRVQLNSVARPPAEDCARAVPSAHLEALAALFRPPAEVIADYALGTAEAPDQVGEAEVVALLQRRPCSLDDLASGLGLHRNEVVKHLGHLLRQGRITRQARDGRDFYLASHGNAPE